MCLKHILAVVQEEELFMDKLMHTPYRIGNIEIPNRIVKSAMFYNEIHHPHIHYVNKTFDVKPPDFYT